MGKAVAMQLVEMVSESSLDALLVRSGKLQFLDASTVGELRWCEQTDQAYVLAA